MSMRITLWGTRGSIPVFGADYLRHGGSTTCIEVELLGASGETPERVVLDFGTGCVALGRARQDWRKTLALQTHLHWDHIQGFPFFAPLFNPKSNFEFWSVAREGKTMRDVLVEQMTAPKFPVGLDILPASLNFQTIATKGSRSLGELKVSWSEVWHPSGSSAWRLEYRGQIFVFTGDVEVQQGCFDEVVELARDADVLVMDAQYTREEYKTRSGWGHSTANDAVSVALAANIDRLTLTHHDPSHTDVQLDEKLVTARQQANARLIIDNAYDKMVLVPQSNQRLAS